MDFRYLFPTTHTFVPMVFNSILFSNNHLLCSSEAYRYSGSLPAYSPDGKYLATAEDFKLVVRDVDTLQVVQLYSCLDRIKQLEWCCRSEYVLCGLTQRPIVQVSVADA